MTEVITDGHVRRIGAGTEWAGQIDEPLNAACVILPLLRADSLAFHYCHDIERKRARERQETGEARVLTVTLRPCLHPQGSPPPDRPPAQFPLIRLNIR